MRGELCKAVCSVQGLHTCLLLRIPYCLDVHLTDINRFLVQTRRRNTTLVTDCMNEEGNIQQKQQALGSSSSCPYLCTLSTLQVHIINLTRAHYQPYLCTLSTLHVHITNLTYAHYQPYLCTLSTFHKHIIKTKLQLLLCTLQMRVRHKQGN
jgi:hypothetical protein